jgi:hypothetical protein
MIVGAMLLFASVANAQQSAPSQWQRDINSCIDTYRANVTAYMQLTARSRDQNWPTLYLIYADQNARTACRLRSLTEDQFVAALTGMPTQIFGDLFGPLLIAPPKK